MSKKKPKVSDKVVDALIQRWMERLRLGRWLVQWNWVTRKALDRYSGEIWTRRGREVADMNLRRYMRKDFDELRHTVIHELVHLALDPLNICVQRYGEAKVTPKAAGRVFWRQWTERLEIEVDSLSRALAKAPGWDDQDLKPRRRMVRR